MTRTKFLCFVVSLTAVVVAIAVNSKSTVLGSGLNAQAEPADLQTVLGVSPRAPQYHLYSGVVNDVSGKALLPVDRKVDLFEPGGLLPSATYDTNKDRSKGNSQFSLDGALSESFNYYPSDEGIMRLHVKSKYFPNGKLQEEDVRHIDGTPEKRTIILTTGEKHVVGYATDGVSILGDALYVPNSCCTDLIVKSEKRYRDNREHLLQYSNVLNGDGTRTIAEFDEHLNQVRTEQWPADGKIPGTVITVLYPDTLHTRFVSRSDGQWDTTDYFRNDGTLEQRAKISASSTRLTVFDSTGQKSLFEQSWAQVMSGVDGVMVSRWFLSDLFEFDGQGNKVRMLSYSTDGLLLCEIKYDVTVGGVSYARSVSYYDATGLLKSTKYYLHAGDDLNWLMDKPERDDAYTATDNIRVVLPSAPEVKPLDIDPHLPVPPAQWHEH